MTTTEERWPVRLFEPTTLMVRELVRYQGLEEGYQCLPLRRHEARGRLDEIQSPVGSPKRIWTPDQAGLEPRDPRWPTRCANPTCSRSGGYDFTAEDVHAVMGYRLMAEVGSQVAGVHGVVRRVDDLPVGALYRATQNGAPAVLERDEHGAVAFAREGFMAVTPEGRWWLSPTIPDRNGATYKLAVWPTSGRLMSVFYGGPPSRWAIHDGELVRAERP
jgi:hypothetical protein